MTGRGTAMGERHWTAWGDPRHDRELVPAFARALAAELGPGSAPRDLALADLAASVPPSRLLEHPLIRADPVDRARHARGRGLADLIDLRGGLVPAFPDGVAYPETDDAVRELIAWARGVGAQIIPFGGGTSVVGHLAPLAGDRPVLSVDLRRLVRLHDFDPVSALATFGAGIAGPDLEAQLRARGFTLGHTPQSFEYSTLGGWIATRSSGQFSLGYGRIERLFAGGRLEAPAGTLDLPPLPASAAGPDLRELVLGSEGRLGILTRAKVRASPLPEREEFGAAFLPNWEAGLAAVRAIVQARLPLLLLRLSDGAETATSLALAGHPRIVGVLERWLALRGLGVGKCLLVLGFAGRGRIVAAARAEALRLVRRSGGAFAGGMLGEQWHRSRFRAPYLRDTLWRLGYAGETVETATGWSGLPALASAVEGALRDGLAGDGERVRVFSHVSHPYPDGANLYTTFLFRLAPDAAESRRRWAALKGAASRAIVAHGGTISHQHGVGLDHLPYLGAEKGELGLAALRAACAAFDPDGMMNPGKLFG